MEAVLAADPAIRHDKLSLRVYAVPCCSPECWTDVGHAVRRSTETSVAAQPDLKSLMPVQVPSALSCVGASMICTSALLLSVTEWLETHWAGCHLQSIMAASWQQLACYWHSISACWAHGLPQFHKQGGAWQRLEEAPSS